MKGKAKVFLVVILVLLTSGYFFSRWFFHQPCDPPSKPKNVPMKAQWFGDCDGGNWIELVSILDGKYHFKIYRDWDGALQMDADFETEGCQNFTLDYLNIQKIIAYYYVGLDDEVRIEIKSDFGQNSCHLRMISPAYGGEDWEIIKGKPR